MSTPTKTTRAERLRDASRQRRDQEKQDVRQAILDAAAALFREHGYERFSLRQVAERIGYSPTTIYLYFTDKDDLLFTVADVGFTRFGEQLVAAAGSTADPAERLAAMGRAYIDFGLQNPAYYQLMFMQRGDFLMAQRAGECEPRIDSFSVLQQAVRDAINAGAMRSGDAAPYADALWALVHGIVAMATTMPFFPAERAHAAATAGFALMLDAMQPEK
jgi:AcrR family transcriptional regulator